MGWPSVGFNVPCLNSHFPPDLHPMPLLKNLHGCLRLPPSCDALPTLFLSSFFLTSEPSDFFFLSRSLPLPLPFPLPFFCCVDCGDDGEESNSLAVGGGSV